MTNQEFLEYMNSGKEVIAGSDIHLKMTELSNEAMKITSELNNSYHTPEEIKVLMEKLTDQLLLPVSGSGRNHHRGRNADRTENGYCDAQSSSKSKQARQSDSQTCENRQKCLDRR